MTPVLSDGEEAASQYPANVAAPFALYSTFANPLREDPPAGSMETFVSSRFGTTRARMSHDSFAPTALSHVSSEEQSDEGPDAGTSSEVSSPGQEHVLMDVGQLLAIHADVARSAGLELPSAHGTRASQNPVFDDDPHSLSEGFRDGYQDHVRDPDVVIIENEKEETEEAGKDRRDEVEAAVGVGEGESALDKSGVDTNVDKDLSAGPMSLFSGMPSLLGDSAQASSLKDPQSNPEHSALRSQSNHEGPCVSDTFIGDAEPPPLASIPHACQSIPQEAISAADGPPEAIPAADSPPEAIPAADSPPEPIPAADSPPEPIPPADSPPEAIRTAYSPAATTLCVPVRDDASSATGSESARLIGHGSAQGKEAADGRQDSVSRDDAAGFGTGTGDSAPDPRQWTSSVDASFAGSSSASRRTSADGSGLLGSTSAEDLSVAPARPLSKNGPGETDPQPKHTAASYHVAHLASSHRTSVDLTSSSPMPATKGVPDSCALSASQRASALCLELGCRAQASEQSASFALEAAAEGEGALTEVEPAVTWDVCVESSEEFEVLALPAGYPLTGRGSDIPGMHGFVASGKWEAIKSHPENAARVTVPRLTGRVSDPDCGMTVRPLISARARHSLKNRRVGVKHVMAMHVRSTGPAESLCESSSPVKHK
jgi:hypothetical protein